MSHRMINLGSAEIGGKKTFIIAEIGSNHNQDIRQAKELMEAAKDCGADAVKFQSIKPEELYNLEELSPNDKRLLDQIALREDWYKELFDYAKTLNIICFSAPTYLASVQLIRDYQVPIYKIASPQTYGFQQIIEDVAKTGTPVIMSTGYCGKEDLDRAVSLFHDKSKLVLLHCISNYPTDCKDVNLPYMNRLKERYGTIVGYSDHTLGYGVPVAAVALGAKVIEKHFTLSRDMEGPDHFFALEKQEFQAMVQCIREVEESLEGSVERELTPFEKSFRKGLIMRAFASKDISEGERLTLDKIRYLRKLDETIISSWDIKAMVGKRTCRCIKKGNPIQYSDLEHESIPDCIEKGTFEK